MKDPLLVYEGLQISTTILFIKSITNVLNVTVVLSFIIIVIVIILIP